MPELPEVETTLRGIAPHVVDRKVKNVIVRQRKLRHTVSRGVTAALPGQRIQDLRRRAKYLLFDTAAGSLILHLGMSGSLKMVPRDLPPGAHDHVDIEFTAGRTLRFRDPRRFGCVLWTSGDPLSHSLLDHLGPEPLGEGFDAAHLVAAARGRKVAIKNLIMNGQIVVGVGNIYASEALYRAGIHPKRAAGRISAARLERLVACIRDVLHEAIVQGGTSLRDFTGGDGEPGYFGQRLEVYGRAGEPCRRCDAPLHQAVIGQRSSFYCLRCQT
jgi:formamidopyrimidine-DNA glycosylase